MIFFFLTKCSEDQGHRRHSYPSFPQCVIIPFRLRIQGSWEILLPLCLFQKSFQSFIFFLGCQREERKKQKMYIFVPFRPKGGIRSNVYQTPRQTGESGQVGGQLWFFSNSLNKCCQSWPIDPLQYLKYFLQSIV